MYISIQPFNLQETKTKMSFIIGHHYNDHNAAYGGSQNTVSLLKTTIEVGEINSDK